MGEELCAWIRSTKPLTDQDVKAFLKGKVKFYNDHSINET